MPDLMLAAPDVHAQAGLGVLVRLLEETDALRAAQALQSDKSQNDHRRSGRGQKATTVQCIRDILLAPTLAQEFTLHTHPTVLVQNKPFGQVSSRPWGPWRYVLFIRFT